MQSYAANYYELLGIAPHATLDEIKAAYAGQLATLRAMLSRREQPVADKITVLREAFRILVDPEARHAYDAKLAKTTTAAAPPASTPSVAGARAAAEPAEWRVEAFRFVGDGAEYFRIWIVNVLLSILTLGIYSAWAKVRREQYFHRNLLLDGSGFDYHGEATAILKGRIIAVVLLVGLSLTKQISLAAYGIAVLCLLPVLPWLAIKAFRFRAFNTSYRGLRFSFHGTYGQAFKVFVGYGLLTLVTLWLAFPLFYRQLRKFVLDNTRYGTTEFACDVRVGSLYKIFLLPGVLFIVLMIALPAVAGIVAGMAGTHGRAGTIGTVFLVIPFAFFLIQAVIVPYITARLNNAVWSASRLGAHRFSSRMPPLGYIGLTVTNWLGIIFTLGLFIPWAHVRIARFRAEYLALEVEGSLDDFVAGEANVASAIGDQTAEMFDLDIGF